MNVDLHSHGSMGGMNSSDSMGGMDMGSSSSSMGGMMMQMFFTTGVKTTLWFSGWTTQSPSGLGGACVGIFFLTVVSRLLLVLTSLANAAWTHNTVAHRLEAREAYLNVAQGWLAESEFDDDLLAAGAKDELRSGSASEEESKKSEPKACNLDVSKLDDSQVVHMSVGQLKSFVVGARRHLAEAPPFSLAVDVPRAVIYALNAFVGYLLMLAVMTYSWPIFISVIIGAGVGELLFGRFAFQTVHDVSAHVHY